MCQVRLSFVILFVTYFGYKFSLDYFEPTSNDNMKPKLSSTLEEMDKWLAENREPVDFTVPVDSPMVNFYRDKCVFLTGGTGFLGQLFVEKLLRTGVKRIYLLSRAKKGKSTKERLSETFSSRVR